MCLSISDQSMSAWLRNQLRIIAAWKSELVTRGPDAETLERLERHQHWLTEELLRLKISPPKTKTRRLRSTRSFKNTNSNQ